MSYVLEIAKLAEQILVEAKSAAQLETELAELKQPQKRTFYVGATNHYFVRHDGTITPGLEGVHREAVALIERQILKANSRIEGLRFKLAKLGKKGGEA